MGAGYGNHEGAAAAAADRPPAKSSTEPGGKPPSGSRERTASGSGAPEHGDVSTPGAGALPSAAPEGGDADPGAG